MTKTLLSEQARIIKNAAEKLDNAVGCKYGMNSEVSITVSKAAVFSWLALCELERVENEVDRN